MPRNKVAKAAYDKLYRQVHREELLAKKREYYHANKEAHAIRSKATKNRNRAALKIYMKKYKEKNKVALGAKRKDYYLKNKETINVRNRKNRVKKIINLFSLYGGRCQHCEEGDWVILEIHHRLGKNKIPQQSADTIYSYIMKDPIYRKPQFQLLCANCHIKANLVDGTNRLGSVYREAQEAMA